MSTEQFFSIKDRVVNRFPNTSVYTTKSGLQELLQTQLKWSCDRHLNEFFPRSYILSSEDERRQFFRDFKIQAAISLLKIFFVQNEEKVKNEEKATNGELSVDPLKNGGGEPVINDTTQLELALERPKNGKISTSIPKTTNSPRPRNNSLTRNSPRLPKFVPASTLLLAIKVINKELGNLYSETDFTEKDDNSSFSLTSVEWLENAYIVQHSKGKFPVETFSQFSGPESLKTLQNLMCEATSSLGTIYQLDLLEDKNMWIVKPGARSRGRGITVNSDIREIMKICKGTGESNGRWIIQKYIERPLLVNEVKCDIRQWLLVDNWNPLKLWIYKQAYFRFCSHKYRVVF